MSTPLHVRPATLDDLDLVIEGNRSMARETEDLDLDDAVLRAGVAAVLRGEVDAFYRLAMADDAVAGQLMITREWSDWRAGHVWWIQSVYVWPDWRRRGVYRTMYAAVQDEARRVGAAGLRLYVDNRNTSAQAVYRRLGMDGDHYRMFELLFEDRG